MEKQEFIESITQEINTCQEKIKLILSKSNEQWLKTPIQENKWSPLELLIHVHLVNDYYLDHIIGKLKRTEPSNTEVQFSFLDRQLTRILESSHPIFGKFPLKTPRKFVPRRSNDVWDVTSTIQGFNDQLELFKTVLKKTDGYAISDRVISLPFFTLGKITIGGAFVVMLAHMKRHLSQIQLKIEK